MTIVNIILIFGCLVLFGAGLAWVLGNKESDHVEKISIEGQLNSKISANKKKNLTATNQSNGSSKGSVLKTGQLNALRERLEKDGAIQKQTTKTTPSMVNLKGTASANLGQEKEKVLSESTHFPLGVSDTRQDEAVVSPSAQVALETLVNINNGVLLSPEEGTNFTDMNLKESQAKTSLEKGKDSFVAENPKILLVDDSKVARIRTEKLLSANGYKVVCAADGIDALKKLEGFMPNIILTDIEMPNMDGFGLVKSIRNNETMEDIPIIVMTSHVNLHLDIASTEGINGFLPKPYSDPDLLEQVKYLLEFNAA